MQQKNKETRPETVLVKEVMVAKGRSSEHANSVAKAFDNIFSHLERTKQSTPILKVKMPIQRKGKDKSADLEQEQDKSSLEQIVRKI